MEYARQEHMRWMLIEAMGVFWITAEIIILHMMLAGRDFLNRLREATPGQWRPPYARILLAGLLSLLILLTSTLGRAWIWPPVHTLFAHSIPGDFALQSLFRQRYHEHMMIWTAFVTGWVVLELLIVYHGWRGYCTLRQLVRNGIPLQ